MLHHQSNPEVRSSHLPEAPRDLLDCFDGGFIVNMADRTDRRREVEEELVRSGLKHPKVEFFSAVTASELNGFPSLGARGCFLSHLGVLRTALGRNYQSVLVMEDDLTLSTNFPRVQREIATRLSQNDWAFAYFGYTDLSRKSPRGVMQTCDEPLGQTHFYGIRQPYIGLLVAYLEELLTRPPGDPRGGPQHVDGAYCMFRATHPSALTLIATPAIGSQRSSRSDVTPRWFDGMLRLRPGVEFIRSLRQRVSR